MNEGLIGKLKEKVWKGKVDLYFRRFSKKNRIIQDYIIDVVNKERYKNGKGV